MKQNEIIDNLYTKYKDKIVIKNGKLAKISSKENKIYDVINDIFKDNESFEE